jgi:hypothetical protein
MLVAIARRIARACEENQCVTGYNLVTRRVLCCRYRRGAEVTRDPDDPGAALSLSTPDLCRSLARDGRSLTQFGRRDDVAVVPADARIIASYIVLRNPGSAVSPKNNALRTSCRVPSFCE